MVRHEAARLWMGLHQYQVAARSPALLDVLGCGAVRVTGGQSPAST